MLTIKRWKRKEDEDARQAAELCLDSLAFSVIVAEF